MGDARAHSPSRAWTFARDILFVAFVLLIATGIAFAVAFISHPVAQSAFDFSLQVGPSSGSVAPGNSTTTRVTATTSTSASTRNIQFSCANLPSGAGCSFTPSACTPTCSTDLVLVTSVGTPMGMHVVTVAGSDGTTSRTTTFSLNVSVRSPSPSFDFSVAVRPASGSVFPGGSASTNVTATLVAGLSHAVGFSCSNLPPATTCAFVPPSCSPTCAVTLTVATSTGTLAGTYAINVTGSDGTVSRTASYSLAVSVPPKVRTLTFQKGDGGRYSRTDDSYIYSGAPNTIFGYDPLLLVDGDGCIANYTICRALLMFPDFIGPNFRQVPANATIISATIQLNVTNSGADQRLYQVMEAWNESRATWNYFATPGMPRSKGPTTVFNTTLGLNTVNITGIVQNWVKGDPNDGVFIWSPSWNGSDYQSSESNHPPKLTVTFRPSPLAMSSGLSPESRPPGNFQKPSLARSPPWVPSPANATVGVAVAMRDPSVRRIPPSRGYVAVVVDPPRGSARVGAARAISGNARL